MEELKRQIQEIKNIEQLIADKFETFGGTVIQLSGSIATLSTEMKYLRRDIEKTEKFEFRISELERQQAQNKGSWLALIAVGSALVSMVSIVMVFMRHG